MICMFYTAQTLSPRRRAVGCDDAFAALKRLGNDEPEVVRERRKNENIAPVPDLLKLFAEGGRYKSHAEALRGREHRGVLYLPYSFLKILKAF